MDETLKSKLIKLPIEHLSLSTRPYNMLKENGFDTIFKLCEASKVEIEKLRNLGKRSVEEIIDKVSNLHLYTSLHKKEIDFQDINLLKQPKILDDIPTENERIVNIPKEIENKPITSINLSADIIKTLKRKGILTVGDLCNSYVEDISGFKRIGSKKIFNIENGINNLIKSYLLMQTGQKMGIYDIFIKCLGNPNYLKILDMRFGLINKKINTLESIGKKIKLTKERVRQIIDKSGNKIVSARILTDYILNMIKNNGNMINHEYLKKELMDKFDFNNFDPDITIKYLVENIQDIKVNDNLYCLEQCACLNCEKLVMYIEEPITAQFDKLSISDIIINSDKYCNENCKEKTKINYDIIKYLVNKTSNNLIAENEYVYTKDMWYLINTNKKNEVTYLALKYIGKPVHYSEVANTIRKHNNHFKNIDDKTIRTSFDVYGKKYCLVGRGTYGLKEWGLLKYKTHGQALINLFKKEKKPLSLEEIVDKLTQDKQYKRFNIVAALTQNPHFARVGKYKYYLRSIAEDKQIYETNELKIRKEEIIARSIFK